MSIPAILLALVVVLSVLTFILQSCGAGPGDKCETPTDREPPAGRFHRGITPSEDEMTMLDGLDSPDSLASFDGLGPPMRNLSWPVFAQASASRGASKLPRFVSEGDVPVEKTVLGVLDDQPMW
ncbi:unnamed protein product [Prorocentrum cordatum]|uniref:Uncharacterized protein n=1 Tax=Prorocentrum cordatum TaxID=2364126 RepID=A0ABN9QEN8_9DINO|nr:unnamed protein product [Polarella glacialis]